jgi:Na+-translocating ferredoxin:NAD+ oxidoreductase RnfG subunit
MNRIVVLLSLVLNLFLFSPASFSQVFMTKDRALKVAFPDADQIEKKTVFLSEEQAKKIESIARSQVDSKLYIFYVGKKGDKTLGYAVIDTHRLRTKTETVMVVINPDGTLKEVEILAFFEPPEHMPTQRWIQQFEGKTLDDSLWIGRGIPNITGATITSNALVKAIRRIMAVYHVAVKGDQ